jgi:adenine-specific DNA-methyltransferase
MATKPQMAKINREAISELIKVLLQDYSADEIKAAVVKRWAQNNNVPLAHIAKGYTSGRFLSYSTDRSFASLSLLAQRTNDVFDLSHVEGAFESIFTDEQRRRHGIVYTPAFIANYLVREGKKMVADDSRSEFKFCDPCCGGATFLISAAEVLFDEGIDYENSFLNHIWGFDRDMSTLDNAQCLIELFLALKQRPLPKIRLNLYECDFFNCEPKHLLGLIGVPDGFANLATNPPYVKLQNLSTEYRSELASRYRGLANGSFSLALLFPIVAQRFLRDGGSMAIITQNNLYTSLAGTEVRRELQRTRSVRRIIDFGHRKVFENASAYTCLLFLTRSRNEAIEFESIRNAISTERLSTARFSLIPFETLDPAKWRLGRQSDLDILKRIENEGFQLGKLAPIRAGFATLKDTVFLVEQSGDKCVAHSPAGAWREIEIDITVPAIKIASVDSETYLKNNNLRVICPYKRAHGKATLLSEEQLKTAFPLAYEYLVECRERLEGRDKGKKVYENWYAWGRTQGMFAPGPKLLTKTFSRGPNFMLDETDSLFCNGYAVFQPRANLFGPAISIRALQRILNSTVMYFYARMTSFQIEGGFECYQKNFIERFGITQVSPEEDHALQLMNQSDANCLIARRYNIDSNYLDDFLESLALG